VKLKDDDSQELFRAKQEELKTEPPLDYEATVDTVLSGFKREIDMLRTCGGKPDNVVEGGSDSIQPFHSKDTRIETLHNLEQIIAAINDGIRNAV
jgi:hypothetical protein